MKTIKGQLYVALVLSLAGGGLAVGQVAGVAQEAAKPEQTSSSPEETLDPDTQAAVGKCQSFQSDGSVLQFSPDDIDSSNAAFIARAFSFEQRSTCAKLLASVALGLKASSLAMQEELKALSAGPLDKDAVKKSRAQSEAAADAIVGRLADSKEVRSESRGPLLATIAYYALTVRDGVAYFKAAKDYLRFSVSVLKSAGFVQKARLGLSMRGTIGYAKDAPGAVRSVVSTTRTLIGYARAHQIEVPNSDQSAIDALGDLEVSDEGEVNKKKDKDVGK